LAVKVTLTNAIRHWYSSVGTWLKISAFQIYEERDGSHFHSNNV
jgi:hypothetical protein